MQYGPARTVEQSATRIPARGPGADGFGIVRIVGGASVLWGGLGGLHGRFRDGRRGWAPRTGSGIVMSTTWAPVARTRSAGAMCRFTPRAPPPIATTSRPSMLASAITGHGRRAPNGVIAPRT